MICTFFGHADTPSSVKNEIKNAVTKAIEEYGVDTFFVGDKGNFDAMTASVLKELKEKYDFKYCVVLSYLSNSANAKLFSENHPTMYPEGLELVPHRFAISHRNKWLVEHSDMVIAYVNHSWGGAAEFMNMAVKKGKKVINLAKNESHNLF